MNKITFDDQIKDRSLITDYCLCAALANHCAAPVSMVIQNLTGHLWNEEEAGKLMGYCDDEE